MVNRASLIAGVALALTGWGMLASLDIPVVKHGGIVAGLAGFELLVASIVVSVILGLVTREW